MRSAAATTTAAASLAGISTRLGAFSTLLPAGASLVEKGFDFLTQEVKRLQEEEVPCEDSGTGSVSGLVVDFPPTVISFETPQPSVAGTKQPGGSTTASRENENGDSSSCCYSSSSSMGEEGGFLCLDDSLSLDAASTAFASAGHSSGEADDGEILDQKRIMGSSNDSSSFDIMHLQNLHNLSKRQSLLRHPPSSTVIAASTGGSTTRLFHTDRRNQQHHRTSAMEKEGSIPHETYLHTLSGTVLNPSAPPVPKGSSQHKGFIKNLRREEKEEHHHHQQKRHN